MADTTQINRIDPFFQLIIARGPYFTVHVTHLNSHDPSPIGGYLAFMDSQ